MNESNGTYECTVEGSVTCLLYNRRSVLLFTSSKQVAVQILAFTRVISSPEPKAHR